MLDDKPSEQGEQGSSGTSNLPSQPQFITAEQFNQGLTQLSNQFQEGLRAIASARNTDPNVSHTPTPINLPTDQEIIDDIQAGGVTKLKQAIQGAVDKVRRDEIDPFKQGGLSVLAQQAKQLALLSGTMPHYTRFKKEIDAAIQNLPIDQRANSDVYKGIHDLIVGQNFSTLYTEQQEAAVRAAREKENTTTPGSQGGRQAPPSNDPNKIPTAEELYGPEAKAALSMLGKGGKTDDQFAQAMGYPSWENYYTTVIKPQQGASANG